MIACGLSMIAIITLILVTTRRKAAVGTFLSFLSSVVGSLRIVQRIPFIGRSEFRIFLIGYLISLLLQLLTTGAILEQGSVGLVVLTALHAGTVAALFWVLLGNALVSTQMIEDGSLGSLVVRHSPPYVRHPHVVLRIVPDLRLTEGCHVLTAIVSPHPRFLRGYNLHLSGRSPIDIQHFRSI